MKLCIKNMVCPRCILVVRQELAKLGIYTDKVELGYVEFKDEIQPSQLEAIASHLEPLGFELLHDPKNKQVEEIKNRLIQKLQGEKLEEHFSIKKYLSQYIGKEYSYASKLFSQREGITIEQYFILLKLEKVKELITYGELTLNEIAWKLGYSSVQHLSSQFKRVLGVSTRAFKSTLMAGRKAIDQVGIDK